MSLTPPRPRTLVDEVADRHMDAVLGLSPMTATNVGAPGGERELDDLSPQGLAARADLARGTLAALADTQPADDVDVVTLAALRERLGLDLELHEGGFDAMELNVIDSPLQGFRDVLDLMPTETVEDWATIAARVAALPAALEGYLTSLDAAAERGLVAPRRQVLACIAQCADLVGPDGFFTALPDRARPDGEPLSGAAANDLARAVSAAAAAYTRVGDHLRDRLLPQAPEADGCGRERYALLSRRFLGTSVDLEETYAWGQAELARIGDEMRDVAGEIVPGGSVAEAMAALDADPRYRLEGTAELQRWMQGKADEAVAFLADTHFDIPEPVRRIECCIAPTHSGAIYYTAPSEDFSRPGRMWWSVPKDQTTSTTWRELTTVYHEGVPGHHLQIGQTVVRSELLNRWRRQLSWVSGHGEGWALYAERLMDELGAFADPGDRLGFLDSQSFRAARVVLDIGVHCALPAPAEVGGGSWTYDKAWAFLTAHANMAEPVLRFELNRYLGWPGQAPSYKIGERIWLDLREEARRREGAAFDLRAFHRRALDVGSVGIDALRAALRP